MIWMKSQKDMQDIVRACFYDDPLKESAERYHRSSEWKETRDMLSGIAKGTALDIGAGRGISSYALAQDGWNVTALEPDLSDVVGAGAIRKLFREANLPVTIHEQSGENLPFPENSFDLVYARQVLHHARDLKKLCREIRRVLRRNGIFLLTREHVINSEKDLKTFLNNHPLHRLYGREHAYTLSEYKNALKGSGLKIDRVLAPYASDINLFPDTQVRLRMELSVKLRFSIPNFLFRSIVTFLNVWTTTPGRLYSFSGHKL